jgi:hypothetical protein
MNRWAIVGCPDGTNASGQAIDYSHKRLMIEIRRWGSLLQDADPATPLHHDLDASAPAAQQRCPSNGLVSHGDMYPQDSFRHHTRAADPWACFP